MPTTFTSLANMFYQKILVFPDRFELPTPTLKVWYSTN